jgi:L-serine dehydratase
MRSPSIPLARSSSTSSRRRPATRTRFASSPETRRKRRSTWLSVGGGFIAREGADEEAAESEGSAPYPFRSGAELLARGRESGLSIAELVRANEAALRPAETVEVHVGKILDVMFACMDRGQRPGNPLLPLREKVARSAG